MSASSSGMLPRQRIEAAGFEEDLAMQLIWHNAERFLGLPRRASA